MILRALCDYYYQIQKLHPDNIARLGWCSRQVSFQLDLSKEGKLLAVTPSPEKRGWVRMVPEQAKRSSGISPNVLCDNSSFILGIDTKGNPGRAQKCFEATKNIHLELFSSVESPVAYAVCSFFNNWNPAEAESLLRQLVDEEVFLKLISGANLVFSVRGEEAIKDPAICRAWDQHYQQSLKEAQSMVCLATGIISPIARLHPSIKGVKGSQAAGASLVGFNERAFESYGHDKEQGFNAPVSIQATFAYSTALNYLLSEKCHHIILGDTTIVYWAEKNDESCSRVFTELLGGNISPLDGQSADTDKLVDSVMQKLRQGKPIDNIELNEAFYVLGLAPNNARLSIRFFYRNSFGQLLNNLKEHYERVDIVGGVNEKKFLTPYMLLKGLENPNSKNFAVSPILGGALMRSILNNTTYPESLFIHMIQRVRTNQDNKEKNIYKVTRTCAAIAKAYLIKNKKYSSEEVTVGLNENRMETPYLLGRLFSVLEGIQQAANPGVKATIKDRYFNSACATPNLAFPAMLKLSESHLVKLKRDASGLAVFYEKTRGELLEAIERFPKRLSMDEQGDFLLGYYHQTQKRYEKSTKQNNEVQEA